MRRTGGFGVALAAALVLASCSSTPDRVQSALDSASSATASVSIALHQLADGKALPAFADTVVGDALTELDSAETELVETGPVGGDARLRDDALDAIRGATDAVLAARETIASGGDPASGIAAIDGATDDLHDLSTRAAS